MTRAEYDAAPGINWSLLSEARRSWYRFLWRKTNPRPITDILRVGLGSHTACLEPERFLADYALWDRGRRYGKEWDRFCEENAGSVILTREQYELCLDLQRAVRNDPIARQYLDGEHEKALFWTDPATGVPCKGRLDILRPAEVVDLKFVRSIDPRMFANEVARYGWHCQGAHYTNGAKATDGKERAHILIACEKDPPHEVGVFRLSEDALYAGAEEVTDLLTRFRSCEELDSWPPRYAGLQVLELPRWFYADAEDDDSGAKWLMGEE